MNEYKSLLSSLLNYGSSLVILIFSMVALHFSIVIIDDHNALVQVQKTHLQENHASLGGEYLESASIRAKHAHANLYWAVIAVGLAGFVVVLLNSDKLRKLRIANDEHKKNALLLEERSAAMEATLDGIGIMNLQGELTYMNTALMKLHGIKPAEKDDYIGSSWMNLYNEKGREQVEEHVFPALEESNYWHGESLIIKKDNGQTCWAELSLTRLEDGGLIGTARDITEKRLAQKEHEQLQSQFYQAQKMEAIGRLAGGVAHDFNNILAAMNGYAEFLSEDLDDDTPQHKFAQNILQAGRQARGLVDQILTFSRRNDSVSEVIDLNQAIEKSVSFLSASMPKTIELSQEIEVEEAHIRANSTQISQVIMNLCVNANDAMEDDHGVLKIGLKIAPVNSYRDLIDESESQETLPIKIEALSPKKTKLSLGSFRNDVDYVCLSVADTGMGMSRQIMEHIFEPFFTTKAVDKGTGLGLATVHGVLLENEGAMIIESMIDQGTIFQLFFPLIDVAEDVESEAVLPETAEQPMNILVVEDQAQVREMLESMFVRMGHDVHTVENGAAAQAYITEHSDTIDVVITDQNMPKITGSELAAAVVKDWPGIPFILMSGYSKEKLETLLEDHENIKATLRKPVSKARMSEALASVVEHA